MGNIEKKFTLNTDDKEKHKFACRVCSGETVHTIVAAYIEDGSEDCGNGCSVDWNVENQIIQCQGCETVSFRVVSSNSEDVCYYQNEQFYNETVKFYPGRSLAIPEIDTYLLPDNVRGIYLETAFAIQNEQSILAGIGMRTLIETICKDQEAEGKDLFNKIDSLKEKGIVTNEGASVLHKLRVLGNAAAHEAKKHDEKLLSLAIRVIEHMLDGTYIIPHKVAREFNVR